MRVDAQGGVALEVRLRNYGRAPMQARITLRLPRGWDCDPARLDLTAPPGGTARGPFRLRVPPGFSWPDSRVAIAADVTADGRHLGQIAEGVVDLLPAAPPEGAPPS
jgi:hypothetical protein